MSFRALSVSAAILLFVSGASSAATTTVSKGRAIPTVQSNTSSDGTGNAPVTPEVD